MKEYDDIDESLEIMDGLMDCHADEFHEATLAYYGLLSTMPSAS